MFPCGNAPNRRVKRRVVITGVGLLTALGNTEQTWRRLLQGESGVTPITRFDASKHPTQIAAEVQGFQSTDYLEPKEVKKMDRFVQFALAAAESAVGDAGLGPFDPTTGSRVGVIVGSGIGGFGAIEREYQNMLRQGPRRVSPFFIPSAIVNLAAGQVSIRFRALGPNAAPCTACAAGSHAVGDSFRLIQRGDADLMITGGSEAAITPLAVAGFDALKALSTRNHEPSRASRPFDRERDGFVLGEGAGILILEEYERALARGAKIYAEVVGYGMSSDAYHMTAPSSGGDGAARAMRQAIGDAGVSTEEIDYVNAHGTSTLPNDKTETAALHAVFGQRAGRLAISSTKSMIGHLLGAAGAVEAAVTALSIRDHIVHPTINRDHPDPDCDLDYVPEGARRLTVRYALSNSFGFGGTNACLLLKAI